jgi:hypothetical protein
MKRRQKQAPAIIAGTAGRPSPGRDGNNITDEIGTGGEGQVRIMIRPVSRSRIRSGQWPFPPPNTGQRYTLYLEQTTTGDTTPGEPEMEQWSNPGEDGSESRSPEVGAPSRELRVAQNRGWFGSLGIGKGI